LLKFDVWHGETRAESFIIAKVGKPLVKVSRLDGPNSLQVKRLGTMAGQIAVPDDFDQMGHAEIESPKGNAPL